MEEMNNELEISILMYLCTYVQSVMSYEAIGCFCERPQWPEYAFVYENIHLNFFQACHVFNNCWKLKS